MLSAAQEEYFFEFYRKTTEGMFRKAYRMCAGHRADAEDALQNAYLKVLGHWPDIGYKDDQRRRGYLATTLTNEVLQMWRSPHRAREAEPLTDSDWRQPGRSVMTGEDALAAMERFKDVCRAIARLEGRPREVMALHCLAGFEIAEVAALLDISASTVRAHLHRARSGVKAMLQGEEGTGFGQ